MKKKDTSLFLFISFQFALFINANWRVLPGYLNFKPKIITTMLRQEWSFFAPLPTISTSYLEFKCITENDESHWLSLSSQILENSKPFSSYVLPNNSRYLTEDPLDYMIQKIDKKVVEFCDRGDCSAMTKYFNLNPLFIKLRRNIQTICEKKSSTIGDKVRIITLNPISFIRRKNTTDRYDKDVIELPPYEY